jgi:hypothetical protein
LSSSTSSSSPSFSTDKSNTDDDDLLLLNDDSSFVNKTKNELLEEAERLRAKAKQILAEARAMEIAMQESTTQKRRKKLQQIDDIISTIFSSKLSINNNNNNNDTTTNNDVPDARVVADRIQNGRYNQEQILAVVDRLYDIQLRSIGQSITATTVEVIPTFQIGGGSSGDGPTVAVNETTYELYGDYIETLTQAAGIIDEGNAAATDNDDSEDLYTMSPKPSTTQRRRRPQQQQSPSTKSSLSSLMSDSSSGRLEIAIRSRLKELRKTQELNMNRRLAAEINKVVTSFNRSQSPVQDFIRRTFDNIDNNDPTMLQIISSSSADSNTTSVIDGVTTEIIENALVPLWVPSTFLPYMVSSDLSTVGPEEVEAIKSQVLTGSRFYVTSYESVPGAALFRGNIRNTFGGVGKANDDGKQNNFSRNATAVVFDDIEQRLINVGLGDKIQLFFMPDPEETPSAGGRRPNVAAMDEEAKPVLLALSKALSPDETKLKKSRLKRIGKVGWEGNGDGNFLFL